MSSSAAKAAAAAAAANNGDNDILDVVIIGAGWAGLSAGRHLQEINGDACNFAIIEARDEIGGRCRTITLQDGISVAELGAQWIHSCDDQKRNPVYQIALESGVSLARSNNESRVVYDASASAKGVSTHRVPQKKVDRMTKDLLEGRKGFLPYQAKRQGEDRDIPLRQCADDYLKKIKATTEQRAWLNFMLDSEICQEYAASLEDLSVHWWDSDEAIPGGDVHAAQKVQGGYKGIMDHFAQPVLDKVQLDSKVRCIDWSESDKIVIQYRHNNNKWKLLSTKHVLITVPLGVLKAKTLQFIPELPESKQNIISKMGVGLLNKCLFLWDESDANQLPWPQDKEWIERIAALESSPDEPEQQGLWTEFFNPYPLNSRPMLCAFTAGRIAARLEESCSEEEIQRSALATLRRTFPDRDIPDPIQVVVTKWGQDEFARGSYSYNAYGAKHRYRDRLADPVDQRLYFAGEACSSKYPSTTHGAFLSGVNAAIQILQDSSNM